MLITSDVYQCILCIPLIKPVFTRLRVPPGVLGSGVYTRLVYHACRGASRNVSCGVQCRGLTTTRGWRPTEIWTERSRTSGPPVRPICGRTWPFPRHRPLVLDDHAHNACVPASPPARAPRPPTRFRSVCLLFRTPRTRMDSPARQVDEGGADAGRASADTSRAHTEELTCSEG